MQSPQDLAAASDDPAATQLTPPSKTMAHARWQTMIAQLTGAALQTADLPPQGTTRRHRHDTGDDDE